MKLYKEHCFPDWLRKEYGEHEMEHALVKGEQVTASWLGKPYQLQVRCTCHSCQHGWMAKLEERAKPFLRSMIEGFGRTLYPNGREIVSTWAIKTSMSFQGATPYDSIPLDHWRHIAAHQTPPRNTQVWLGAVDDANVTPSVSFHWHNGLRVEEANMYVAALAVGHLAIVVIGIGAEDPMTRKLGGWPREALVEIWPTAGSINWPPGLIMDIPRFEVLGSAEFSVGG